MDSVVLASDGGDAAAGTRGALVLQRIEAAMGALARVETRTLEDLDACPAWSAGVRQVRLPEPLVAFDRAAHVGLADFRKRTIFTRELNLVAPDLDIERLVWSSVNTSRAIALSQSAWTSMQALPIVGISRHHMPPIRLDPLPDGAGKSSVRIICHDAEQAAGGSLMPLAMAALGRLERAGFEVALDAVSWHDESAIHLHIGPHQLDDDGLRIVDSWASGRLVVQMRGLSHARPRQRDWLLVEHEANGIACNTPADLAVACEELRGDPTFWAKLLKVGGRTVAPLQRGWTDIASAILA